MLAKGDRFMGTRKLRTPAAPAKAGALAVLLAVLPVVLLAGCGQRARIARSEATAPALVPAMTPTAVPVLGSLRLGSFPSTSGGSHALRVCQDWGWLRAQYVARVQAGNTPLQLEQWFSGNAWEPAFNAAGPLDANPDYLQISTAFGLATSGQSAGIAQARHLDAACTAAD